MQTLIQSVIEKLRNPMSPKHFCWCVASFVCVSLFCVSTLNWIVNPYGQYSSNCLQPIVQDSRSEKVELMGWLLFRSVDLQMAQHWYAAIFGLQGIEADIGRSVVKSTGFIVAITSLFFCWLAPNAWDFQPRWSLGTAIALSALLVVCVLRFDAESPFLYFQF